MEPNLTYIKKLMEQQGWSSNELARRAGLSKSEVSRFLRGQRSGGNKMISGLLKAFDGETLQTLFILPAMSPNVNTSANSVPLKKDWETARHPCSHGIDCKYNEAEGKVEITRGNCVTTLNFPPCEITVEYTQKQK